MQILTLEEVKKNAREYYEKGLLTAQHPVAAFRQCVNKDGDYRCAVAASYSAETLEHKFGTVEAGIKLGYISVENPLELAAIVRIQMIHDLWADSRRQYEDHPLVHEMERSFKFRINLFT